MLTKALAAREAVYPFLTDVCRRLIEELLHNHGRSEARDSEPYVSVLTGDLSLDQRSHRPVCPGRHTGRVPPGGARGMRGHDGAAGEGPALLLEARPGAVPGHPALLPDPRSGAGRV